MKALLSLLALAAACVDAGACSTFVLHDDRNTVFAHHMDERGQADGVVFINPRGTARTSVGWNEFATGKPGPRAEWVSTWGSITIGMMGVGLPDGGVNEKGLYIEEMSLVGSQPPTEGRVAMHASAWMQYVLDTAATVDDALESLRRFAPDGMEWHYLIADAQGHRAAVELTQGQLIVHKNAAMDAPLVCNEPYAQELAQFKTLSAKLDASPAGWDRFSKGAWRIQSTASEGATLARAKQVLEALQQDHTRWTHAVDFGARTFHLRTSRNPQWRSFSWSDADFARGPTRVANLDTVATQADFKPVTPQMHADIANRGLDNILRWLGPGRMEGYLQSIGSSLEQHRRVIEVARWADPG